MNEHDVKTASAATAQWHMKIDDGSIFGPVGLTDLRDWAENGRIAPGYQLSKNREEWIAAESLPALGMTWRVELVDGTLYGPLNLLAVRDLMNDGAVAERARLINDATDETSSVDAYRAVIMRKKPLPDAAANITEGDARPVALSPAKDPKARQSAPKDAVPTMPSVKKEPVKPEETSLTRLMEQTQAQLAELVTCSRQSDEAMAALRKESEELAESSRLLDEQIKALQDAWQREKTLQLEYKRAQKEKEESLLRRIEILQDARWGGGAATLRRESQDRSDDAPVVFSPSDDPSADPVRLSYDGPTLDHIEALAAKELEAWRRNQGNAHDGA